MVTLPVRVIPVLVHFNDPAIAGETVPETFTTLDIPRHLSSIKQSIEEQGEAIRAAYERDKKQDREQQRRVEIQFDENQIRDHARNTQEQNRIQKSTKRATWATFWAAFAYGALTLLLWLNAREQLILEQRGWVIFDPSYSDTVELGKDNTMIRIPFRIENIGRTPVRGIDGFVMVEEVPKGKAPNLES